MLEEYVHEKLDDDVGINENNDILSYLLDDGVAMHDDYWGSFGFPIYDSSWAPSVVLVALETLHFKVIFGDHS